MTRSYSVPLSEQKHRGKLIQKTKKLAVNIRLSSTAIEDVAEVAEVKK